MRLTFFAANDSRQSREVCPYYKCRITVYKDCFTVSSPCSILRRNRNFLEYILRVILDLQWLPTKVRSIHRNQHIKQHQALSFTPIKTSTTLLQKLLENQCSHSYCLYAPPKHGRSPKDTLSGCRLQKDPRSATSTSGTYRTLVSAFGLPEADSCMQAMSAHMTDYGAVCHI